MLPSPKFAARQPGALTCRRCASPSSCPSMPRSCSRKLARRASAASRRAGSETPSSSCSACRAVERHSRQRSSSRCHLTQPAPPAGPAGQYARGVQAYRHSRVVQAYRPQSPAPRPGKWSTPRQPSASCNHIMQRRAARQQRTAISCSLARGSTMAHAPAPFSCLQAHRATNLGMAAAWRARWPTPQHP